MSLLRGDRKEVRASRPSAGIRGRCRGGIRRRDDELGGSDRGAAVRVGHRLDRPMPDHRTGPLDADSIRVVVPRQRIEQSLLGIGWSGDSDDVMTRRNVEQYKGVGRYRSDRLPIDCDLLFERIAEAVGLTDKVDVRQARRGLKLLGRRARRGVSREHTGASEGDRKQG